MNNYQRLKKSENRFEKLKQCSRVATLMFLVLVFGFPHISSSQTSIKESEALKPFARVSVSNYYDGPTLPEIPRREPRRVMRIPVTSYNSEPGQTDDTPFITASGTRTRDGVVAANFLTIGTIVRFPEVFGDKEFIVEDRMNKRYYYKADIWMENKQDSINFGSQYLKIEIL